MAIEEVNQELWDWAVESASKHLAIDVLKRDT